MIITKKSHAATDVPARDGATMALPLLDSMVPAATPLAKTPANPVRRLGFVFMPMGCDITRWTPPGENKLDELSPILEFAGPGQGTRHGDHESGVAKRLPRQPCHLQLRLPERRQGEIDRKHGLLPGHHSRSDRRETDRPETQLPSLEMAMDLLQVVGQCDNGYACVYQNNLSWSSPTTPLPAEAHPRIVFESMFGEGGSKADRQAALRKKASLLDWFNEDIARLNRKLGPGDRARVSQYLDTVREVERRIQKAEADAADNPLPDLDRPVGVPAAYADHARLMFDLQVLAMQGDVTRVITFQLARETSNRTYPEIGVSDPHHPLSHHGNDPEKIARMAKINQFHVSLFAEFLGKLKATPEGNGTLLDHSLYLYGSGIGNPNIHDHTNLPILVAGGAAAGMKGGRHIKYDKPKPLANLHLTLLDKVGVHLDSFADSNGKMDELFQPLSV
jgi:hypothetical protein